MGGQMVGDALGASVEGKRRMDILAQYPKGLDVMLPNSPIFGYRPMGSVTDDTQMALCLHRSLLDADGWSPQAAMARYLEWYQTDPPDVGCATCRDGGLPHAESQGNGTLMRVMPLALWAASHPGFDWETAAREDAALTHPNPIMRTVTSSLYLPCCKPWSRGLPLNLCTMLLLPGSLPQYQPCCPQDRGRLRCRPPRLRFS